MVSSENVKTIINIWIYKLLKQLLIYIYFFYTILFYKWKL